MAARRLLIVMLVLLGISTLAAALVPTQSLDEDEPTGSTTTGTTPTEPPDSLPEGKDLGTLKQIVGGDAIPVIGKDDPVNVGDHLRLVLVCRCEPDLIEIPALGLVDAVAPGSPARFDLLFTAPGSYGVRLTSTERVVARIEVEKLRSRARGGSARP